MLAVAETYKKQIRLRLNGILKDKTLSDEVKKEQMQVLCEEFDKVLQYKIHS